MNELVTQIRRSTCPTPQSREAAEAIARRRNRLTFLGAGRYAIPDTVAPGGPERVTMAARREEIASGLGAASDGEIDFMLSSLFMAFAGSADGPDGLRQKISVYRAALRGMPAWAIRLACSAWVSGKAGGHLAFAPSAPELRAEAEKRVVPLRAEAADIGKILGAEVVREPSEEERASVLARMAELMSDLAATSSMQAAAEPLHRHRYFEDRDPARGSAIDHSAPVKLSAGARALFGLPTAAVQEVPAPECYEGPE